MFANKMDCITKLVLSLFMLINPKLAQIFVRHKLKRFFFFNMGGTVASRSSFKFFQLGATDLQLMYY